MGKSAIKKGGGVIFQEEDPLRKNIIFNEHPIDDISCSGIMDRENIIFSIVLLEYIHIDYHIPEFVINI